MKRDYNTLTLVFNITDKEKFSEFHKKVLAFMSHPSEVEAATNEFGGHAIVSSWGNMNEEKDNLERALDFVIPRLDWNDAEICELMSDEGLTVGEARLRIKENEE